CLYLELEKKKVNKINDTPKIRRDRWRSVLRMNRDYSEDLRMLSLNEGSKSKELSIKRIVIQEK
ncbi:hypothetical protein LCGC14_1448410, partial [marine sediment metagenome]